MRPVWLWVFFSLLFSNAFSQNAEIHGIVSDQQGGPLSFVSIWVDGAHQGALTNENGLYRLILGPGTYSLSFRSPGYEPSRQIVSVRDSAVICNPQLSRCPEANELTNPADSIIHLAIFNQKATGDSLTTYSGHLYTRELQQVIDVPSNFLKNVVGYRLRMSPYKKGIINFSESLADFQISSKKIVSQEITAQIITRNSRSVFNFNKVPELHIDFRQDIIYLKNFDERGFMSPLAAGAFACYSYRLTSRFADGDRMIDAIQVQPAKPDDRLFSGTIYIVEHEWQLYGAELRLTGDARIDFIDSIKISQQYIPADHGDWLPQAAQFKFYGHFWGYRYTGSFTRVYKNIDADTSNRNVYRHMFHSMVKDYQKDQKFWNESRAMPLTMEEESFYQMRAPEPYSKKHNALSDSLQNGTNHFRPLPYFLVGYSYHDYQSNSYLGIDAPYNVFFYNTVEGWGVDLKLKYLKIYDKQQSLSLTPEVRYGFSDRVLNGNLSINYVYNSYRHGSVYGRFGADFLDLNNTGTISSFLNSLTTLYFGSNYLKLYQSRFAMAGTSGEIISGILLNGQVEYADRRPLFNTTLHTFDRDSVLLTSNNPLDPYANSPLFPQYRALTLHGSATFTFNEEYMITPDGKFILPAQYPVVRINVIAGVPILQSVVNYDFLSVDIFQQRVNTGVYGYTSFYLSGGGFLNVRKLYYPDYKHFHGGQSFFLEADPGGFHFLNFYSYSADRTYFEIHAEHNFTGKFIERVPVIGRLGLQEIIGASYLTQGSLPDYKEIYVGLKRTIIQLDYGLAFGRFTKVIQGFRFGYNIP